MIKLARKVVSILTLLAVVALAVFAYFFVSQRFETKSDKVEFVSDSAVVTNVVDGDTVDLDIDGVTERVRLIGIDTPETVSRQTPKQCFGAEASAELKALLPEGSRVRIERDVGARDRYGRLLLYIYRYDDNLFINQWMVENGFASAVSYRPNTSFEDQFTAAEQAAQRTKVGLWAVCDGPDQPLDPDTSG